MPFPATVNLYFHLAFCVFLIFFSPSQVLKIPVSLRAVASLVGFRGQPLSGLTGPASSRACVEQPARFIPVHVSTACSDVYLLFVTLHRAPVKPSGWVFTPIRLAGHFCPLLCSV